ncbi:O-antigen ligase family protein [Candidatus Ozemobacteraceae bacterium]|nr:O-antigen ligase family protein [Candidatus Ozemobacteraceae bacterium]
MASTVLSPLTRKAEPGMQEAVFAGFLPAFVILVLPVIYAGGETTAVFLLEMAAAGLLLGRLFGIIGHESPPRASFGGPTRRFWQLVPVWLVLVGLSVVTSENAAASFPAFLKLLALVMLAVAAANDAGRAGWLAGICISAGLAGMLHGTLALQEYAEGAPMPLTWADPALRAVIRTRCAGMFTDPNVFGAFLAALLPWQICGLALASGEWRKHESRLQAFFGAALLMTGIALLMTFSRGAYLAAIVGIVVSTAIWKPSPKRPWSGATRILSIVIILLAIIFISGPFKYRFISIGNTKDMTFSQRTLINKGIYAAAANVPWTGYGLHTFSQVYPRFRRVGGDYPMNAHNEFLQTFVEAGPLAATLLAVLSLILWWIAAKRAVSSPGSWPVGAAAGCWAVFFLHNLSGFSSRMLPTSAFFALAVGALLAASLPSEQHSDETATDAAGKLRSLAISLLLVYLLFAVRETRHQQHLDAASAEIAAGELRTAEARLAELRAQRPSDPMVWALSARAAEARADSEAALGQYARAAEINPREALFWSERARIIAAASAPADALPLMRRAIELDPASEQFRLEAARLHLALNRPQEALNELDAALQTSPGFHDVYRIYRQVEELRRQIAEQALPAAPREPATTQGLPR